MVQSAESYLESSRGETVLLVEEDLEYLESLRRVIQACGYNVSACNSYLEGIGKMQSGAFDIIIAGQGSRNFEGRGLLEAATAFDRRLPVVVVARQLEMGCYLEAMQLGALDYISPGLLGLELARVIQTHMRQRKSRVGSVSTENSAANANQAWLVA